MSNLDNSSPEFKNKRFDIERMPPYNLEAEQGLLASILMDNSVLHDVVTLVIPDDFYRDSHQIIFRQMRVMYDEN